MEGRRVLVAAAQPGRAALVRTMLHDAPLQVEVMSVEKVSTLLLELVSAADPEAVLLDIELCGRDGAVVRSLRQEFPAVPAVLFSDAEDEEQLFLAIRWGAAAYVALNTSPESVKDTVRRARDGAYVIDEHVLASPRLAHRVLGAFRELSAVDQRVQPLFAPLSPREIEVLEHAARGGSNKIIARAMGISEQTVKNHLTSIMRKLAVNDRTQAVVYALQHGWINVDDV